MNNFRAYGNPPYSAVVVHGGPGTPGGMRPVAEELSKTVGVIEPFQTFDTISDQIDELRKVIEEHALYPVYLIGWSWGAWLCYLLAAQYTDLVKKLILVSSGPFEVSYAKGIMKTRLERLSMTEKMRVEEIMKRLQSGKADNIVFSEFSELMDRADSYRPIGQTNDNGLGGLINPAAQSEIYERVWSEAEKLRKSGKLLAQGKKITCPVIAIHGDYDPHPAEGVRKPLSKILSDFHFYVIEHCGHHPWLEQEAKDTFYILLRQEIKVS
ncbi:alpha/beta hydrolase [Candidatus Roizmanbacteria bacterium RIFCSPLOWO2_01_FULL_42_14]|uniref:Alpha/beta hydrolase n=1 Tax=Candidatus Roizmanbacteria bacterium RIFCSPLOWO2_01_FULL_42_14 TaxID=1802068 RepID=A0A1F7J8L4_9BACT|nr:MAG: alpha/beta hydrolase [Candidatus Roizmanbacteria bacterium RIFCSPLOWO2_01_FULL_42_14]